MSNDIRITNEKLQSAYQEGYNEGKAEERKKLVEKYSYKEARGASRGILLGLLFAAIVGCAVTFYKIARGFPTQDLSIPVTVDQPSIDDENQ
jgi:hypothetical protein